MVRYLSSKKDDPTQVSRLRMSWQMATAEVSGAIAKRTAGENLAGDMDTPLDHEVQANQEKNFREHYHLKLDPEAVPSDSLYSGGSTANS